jgi:hypothetical protein
MASNRRHTWAQKYLNTMNKGFSSCRTYVHENFREMHMPLHLVTWYRGNNNLRRVNHECTYIHTYIHTYIYTYIHIQICVCARAILLSAGISSLCHSVKTGSGVHPDFYPRGTGCSFHGGTVDGARS